MSDFTQGGYTSLARASEYAKRAGKARTAAWLLRCARIVSGEGFDVRWPEAPAYKGRVVYVEGTTEEDLRALNAVELDRLGIMLDAERFRRRSEDKV